MFDPVEKLKEFIRQPSVSTDPAYHEGMRGAQEFVSGLLGGMGFKVDVVPTSLHPIILAERGGDPSWPKVVIYGHYDVQPADPLAGAGGFQLHFGGSCSSAISNNPCPQ